MGCDVLAKRSQDPVDPAGPGFPGLCGLAGVRCGGGDGHRCLVWAGAGDGRPLDGFSEFELKGGDFLADAGNVFGAALDAGPLTLLDEFLYLQFEPECVISVSWANHDAQIPTAPPFYSPGVRSLTKWASTVALRSPSARVPGWRS